MHPTILFKKLLIFAAILSEVKAAPQVVQVRDLDTRGEGNGLIPRQANTCRNDLLYGILRALSASKFCTTHLQFTTPKTVYVTATRTMPTVTQLITNTVTTTTVQTVQGPPTVTVLTTITVGEPRIVDQVVPVTTTMWATVTTSQTSTVTTTRGTFFSKRDNIAAKLKGIAKDAVSRACSCLVTQATTTKATTVTTIPTRSIYVVTTVTASQTVTTPAAAPAVSTVQVNPADVTVIIVSQVILSSTSTSTVQVTVTTEETVTYT